MTSSVKPKLNKAQRENQKEIEAFRKKENASYRAHQKTRAEEKKQDKLYAKKHKMTSRG